MMILEDLEYDEDGFILLTTDKDMVFDRTSMTYGDYRHYHLTPVEKEIATQLINDAYYGTFDELIMTVRKLARE